jgi:hypothetical protein
MTSDRRARAGGEIDGLAEANGAVLAMPREEVAKEHGDDVSWVVAAGVDRDLCFQLVR